MHLKSKRGRCRCGRFFSCFDSDDSTSNLTSFQAEDGIHE